MLVSAGSTPWLRSRAAGATIMAKQGMETATKKRQNGQRQTEVCRTRVTNAEKLLFPDNFTFAVGIGRDYGGFGVEMKQGLTPSKSRRHRRHSVLTPYRRDWHDWHDVDTQCTDAQSYLPLCKAKLNSEQKRREMKEAALKAQAAPERNDDSFDSLTARDRAHFISMDFKHSLGEIRKFHV